MKPEDVTRIPAAFNGGKPGEKDTVLKRFVHEEDYDQLAEDGALMVRYCDYLEERIDKLWEFIEMVGEAAVDAMEDGLEYEYTRETLKRATALRESLRAKKGESDGA